MANVLHLIETSGPGGAERMLISLVEGLDRPRYHSTICLLEEGWLQAELLRRGFETVILPQNGSYDVAWIRRVVRLIKSRGISLMHAHEFTMNAYGSIVSAVSQVPLIGTVHGKSHYPDKWRRRLAYRYLAKRSVLVAVSEDIREFLMRRIGIGYSQIVTVHNGVDVGTYGFRSDVRGAIRSSLGLSATQPVIGTVGNLYPVKGHRYLLDAAPSVMAAFPDAVFLIAGRGELLEPLSRQARELGLAKNVMFLGLRNDVPSLLQAMDVFVLPSLSEGLPVAVLEAMATARPVVATNVGGNPEAITDGESGFLVPPADPCALAEKIVLLLRDRALAGRVGERGRLRAERQFTLPGMVNSYQALYAACLANGHGTP